MSDTDQLFEQLLAETQEAYSKASSNWMPDPADYSCLLLEVQTGTFKADKNNPASPNLFFIKPLWQIIGHTTLDQVQFTGSMLTNRSQGSLGVMKGFLEKLNGEATDSLADAVKKAKGLAGTLCQIRITESKDGKYKNDRIQEVLEYPTAEGAVAAA